MVSLQRQRAMTPARAWCPVQEVSAVATGLRWRFINSHNGYRLKRRAEPVATHTYTANPGRLPARWLSSERCHKMPREQKPIRPIQVDYRCDKCGEGHYRPTGMMLASNHPQFPHACNKCDDRKTFSERYPTVRYALEGGMLDLENYQQQTL